MNETWTVEGRGDTFAIVDEMDEVIATVAYPEDATGDPLASIEGKRATLLASAPDLLKALEFMCATFLDGNVKGIEGMSFAKQARRAIAQAKGEAV